MDVDMAGEHATFRQTVPGDKGSTTLTGAFKNGSSVLVGGRPHTSSHGRSNKLEPRWFGPLRS